MKQLDTTPIQSLPKPASEALDNSRRDERPQSSFTLPSPCMASFNFNEQNDVRSLCPNMVSPTEFNVGATNTVLPHESRNLINVRECNTMSRSMYYLYFTIEFLNIIVC